MSVTLVHPRPKFAPARLTEPPPSGYLHIAAAVEPPDGIGRPGHSRDKTHLLDVLRAEAEDLASLVEVKRASVYRAAAVAPTVGLHSDTAHPARYDVVVLVETRTPQDIDQVQDSAACLRLHRRLEQAAGDVHVMAARCDKCVADVGRSQEGLFQFSYFVGDDPELTAELWEHLAGWYAAETGLDNSLLLQPLDGTTSDYCFVGHAHWDLSLAAVALRQFSKPSFYRFLQPTLKENRTTVMPVLYHLVRLRDR
ncbi:hypothetical protein AB0N07_27380 [Streptomyces sp. NPDC051172]|uniref:hypothetical protein n=1 Tax=Streptomyces sp. NPDC051172 TaxID=3155796 RepID=UPI00342A41D7